MSFSIRYVKIDDVQGKLLMLPATLYETVHISIKSSELQSLNVIKFDFQFHLMHNI